MTELRRRMYEDLQLAGYALDDQECRLRKVYQVVCEYSQSHVSASSGCRQGRISSMILS